MQSIVEQEKAINLMGTKLREKSEFISTAEHALKEKFFELYRGYKAALVPFGAEPLPCPGDEDLREIFSWMKEEFESLPEVILGISDFAASFCLDSTLQLLERRD